VRRHARRRGEIHRPSKMSFDLGIHAQRSNSQKSNKNPSIAS
jgi:hypothetical protein